RDWSADVGSSDLIAQEQQPQFSAVPGWRAFPSNPPSFGQRATSKPINFVVMSQATYPEMAAMVELLMDKLADYPGLQNLDTDLRLNTPELKLRVNRDKLADVGVDVGEVGRTLETMLGGRNVTRFRDSGEQYDVIVQVKRQDRSTPSDIQDIYVRTRDGGMV